MTRWRVKGGGEIASAIKYTVSQKRRWDFFAFKLITGRYQLAMELRHLRYFVAVAEDLNYRRAASRLGVAQPALSKQIKSLEEEIGTRLLERDTGSVMLTDAGAVFLDEARDVIERAEMAGKAARDAGLGTAGRLSVGCLGAVTSTLLPAALTAFGARYPKVEVSLHESPLAEQILALQRGTVQVAFATRQIAATNVVTLAATTVMSARIVVAVGKHHRLAGRATVPLADLATENILCIGGNERQQQHRATVEAIMTARGIRHLPIKRVNGFESLVALIAAGHGVSLLLPFAPTHHPDGLRFCNVYDRGPDLIVEIAAVWSRRGNSQLVRNFVQVLVEQGRISGRRPRR